jgi:hypothetical protein
MGQITIDTWLGSFLKDICQNHPDVKTVVEIGTWDGMGSTKCIIDGLLQSSKTDIKFISLESNPNMYSVACNAWNGKLPSWASLIHGRVLDAVDMDSSDLSDQEKVWFNEDLAGMETCPNVVDTLPDQIDLLLLDGGEFSTKSEFLKLISRSKVVILDDTNARKCKWIREQVLTNTTQYEVLFDAPHIRGGVMAFIVIKSGE